MLRPWLYTEQKRSGNAHKLTGSQESDAQKHEGNGVVQCGRLTSASASPLKQRSLRLVGRAASSPQASKCARELMIRRFAKKLRAGQGRLELHGAAARLDLQQSNKVMRTSWLSASRCTLTTIVCVIGSLVVLGHSTGGQGSGVFATTLVKPLSQACGLPAPAPAAPAIGPANADGSGSAASRRSFELGAR
jgi:hypothetical protein